MHFQFTDEIFKLEHSIEINYLVYVWICI